MSAEAQIDGVVVEDATHFNFEHKIFATEGGFFSFSRRTNQVFFNLRIGDMAAKIPVNTLCNEFKIDEESADGKLLKVVRDGIQYVKEIRPGDSIPAELLDGTASWSIEERHREAAKAKLMAVTLDWLDGGAGGTVNARLGALAEDDGAQKRVNEALAKIAEELKLGDNGKQQVINRFEDLARELGYIEALREHYVGVRQIQRSLKMLHSLYSSDRALAEDIWRMIQLMNTPIDTISDQFQQIDAHTEDIKSAIRNFEGEIEYIRTMRDKLHVDSIVWDDMLERWKPAAPEPSPEMETLLKETYRFLAQNFTAGRQWGR